MEQLIEAYNNYISLLTNEITELAQLAAISGWKSTRYEEGVKARARIEKLIKQLQKKEPVY